MADLRVPDEDSRGAAVRFIPLLALAKNACDVCSASRPTSNSGRKGRSKRHLKFGLARAVFGKGSKKRPLEQQVPQSSSVQPEETGAFECKGSL
jgi:hypothetical protein